MSGLPLANKRIVVTRPRAQADDLRTKLAALGATVLLIPVIEIAPLADYSALDEAIQGLVDYDWAVFTSVNGVDAFWTRCQQIGVQPHGMMGNVAAIGPATAATLQAYGIQPALVPQRYVAEGVIGELGDVNGLRILLVRAEKARETLPDELQTRGAWVDDVPAYKTRAVMPDAAALTELRQGVDIITFTSSSAVISFADLVRQSNIDVLSVPVACLGPITAMTASQANFKSVITATTYTTDGLIAAILEYCKNK